MNHIQMTRTKKKTIFKALFIPLFLIMVFQAIIFYAAAVYGGIEETMDQNAADIFNERITNRKNEVESFLTKDCFDLETCNSSINQLYKTYTEKYGAYPLTEQKEVQEAFLKESSQQLIHTLRNTRTNGIFLILNDQKNRGGFSRRKAEEKMGICIRDLDQDSTYAEREDLLLERAPSGIIDQLDCALESWWEPKYSFESIEQGAYYYNPLNAAWDNPDVNSSDLAYFDGAHHISASDQEVVSYSIPLMDENGYPYGVLGVELTTRYLAGLLPYEELGNQDQACYFLALEDTKTHSYEMVLGTGAMYNRCFGKNGKLTDVAESSTGGFTTKGREGTLLYGDKSDIHIYNNNNPFEDYQLTLVGVIEENTIFSMMQKVKKTLATVSMITLILGLLGLLVISERFSAPIKALSKRVETMPPRDGFQLERIGIQEIDQLVDSIEELNRNASRNTARTEFFSRMSHDMRTPMNAIISFSSQELLADADEKKKMEYLNQIHTSGEYLLGLINEVLDITKIENNKIELQYVSMPSSQLWNTTLTIIEKLAKAKNIRFVKDLQIQEQGKVLVDEQHLNQILINLLSNAVKFTEADGEVLLRIREKQSQTNENKMRYTIIVSDNGIGMSKQFMKQMYDPFEQESENKQGTGLGLSIAKNLVEIMGGTISCVSKKGMGTTFTIHMELEKSMEIEQKEYQDSPISEGKTKEVSQMAKDVLRGKRVLVCEDHPVNLQIIATLLEQKEMVIESAENGQKGIEMFEQSEIGYYDVILMDIRMPVVDGLEATKIIRSMKREDAQSVPIIAMTANAFAQDVKKCKEAGMNEHLSKPVEPQKVFAALYDYLRVD